MTIQIRNRFLYKNTVFGVYGDRVEARKRPDLASNDPQRQIIVINESQDNQVNFNPGQVGLELKKGAVSSACWRGYYFDYAICSQRLTVKNLYVYSDDLGPTNNGVTPIKRDDYEPPCYEEINYPTNYSGSMLLATGYIEGLNMSDELRLCVRIAGSYLWMFETVIELVFNNGLLVREIDHSLLILPIRQQIVEKAQQEAEERAWLETRDPETLDAYADYLLKDIATMDVPREKLHRYYFDEKSKYSKKDQAYETIEDEALKWRQANEPQHSALQAMWAAASKPIVMRKLGIECVIREREIPHLLHFTKLNNLKGILKHGIYPHSRLEELPYDVEINDIYRWDNRPESVSLSIGHPNSLMFYKYRQLTQDDWVVIQIDPNVLWQWNCAFCKHNAADRRISRENLWRLTKVYALYEMFSEIEGLPSRDKSGLFPFDPTDPQAEVLAFDVITPNKILGVVFRDETPRNKYAQKYPGLNTSYRREGASVFSDRSTLRGI